MEISESKLKASKHTPRLPHSPNQQDKSSSPHRGAMEEEDDSHRILSFLSSFSSQSHTISNSISNNGGEGFGLQHIKEEVILEDLHRGQRGEKEKGAFWPQRPSKADPSLVAAGVKANTVLTNLQRGNIPTMQTIVLEPVIASLHQRAGQGELKASELHPRMLNERDHRRRTPLMWSSFYGQTPTVNLLLKHGADAHAQGDETETALHLAATNGHHDVVRVLLSHGAMVDALDENSCTPMMFAAMQNHPHSVHELLQQGADVTVKNINGDTAVSLAVKCEAFQAQAVLEQHILGFMRDVADGFGND